MTESGAVYFKKPSGETCTTDFCERNLNLLAHAQALELDIGSECGGHGVCGKDRLLVAPEDQGRLSPPTHEERRHLSAELLAQGWRLGCQSYPNRSADVIWVSTRV